MNTFILFVLLILSVACSSSFKKVVNKVKYSTYEMVGLEKRDLFKREVANVKEEQEETGEAFKDALIRLKEIYSFDGGNLEKEYNKLDSSYSEAQEKVLEVGSRVANVDRVAQDLFKEWETEISEISTQEFKSKSKKQLSDTQDKYGTFYKKLKQSEKTMFPVLTKLKDHVLYLKHNLNAKAIAGLKTESLKIESDIEKLIAEMDASTEEADKFIKSL